MNRPELFDVHTHLQFAAYDQDREEVIKHTLETGVWAVNVGTRLDTSRAAIELAEKYSGLYAAVGLHPVHTHESFHDAEELGSSTAGGFRSRDEEIGEEYFRLAAHPKVVAIGECGLDYFHLPEGREKEAKAKQRSEFLKQIELSAELKKPLMIHCRQAFGDLIAMFEENRKLLDPARAGVIHFFTGSKEEAQKLVNLGFYFSFGGVLTITGDYDEAVISVPADRILLETDAPYVAPRSHRGRRNEPLYVKEVAERLAEIRSVSYGEIAESTVENAFRIFNIT